MKNIINETLKQKSGLFLFVINYCEKKTKVVIRS